MTYLKQRLAAYPQPLWRDLEVIADPAATPRQKVAARLTKMEKSLLQGCLDALKAAAAPVGGDDLCNDVAVKTMVGAATAQALVKLS